MKVLAFAASNHSQSINRALVGYAAKRLQRFYTGVEIEFIDLNDYEMPIYSIDRENANGVHALAQELFCRIGASDALIVSFAEYNGFVTAAWKNIYDWMSRIDQKVWQDRPLALLAATPGPRAGENVLQTQELTAPFFGMNIKGKYGVGNWRDVWDGSSLKKPADVEAIDAVVKALLA
ncbi:MAG: NAD(P)H-dependent oxidoreductase [Pseudomonadota bacterium]